MKGSSVYYAGLSLSALGVEALTLQSRQNGAPRVVGLDIQRRAIDNPIEHDRIRRRAGTLQTTLDNYETLYFTNVTVGTPAQSQRLHIDTGSSDLWVNTPSSKFCSTKSQCAFAGSYSANSSSTYQYVASNFNITYEDGSGATGDYAKDTVGIGSGTLTGQQFGIGYTSSSAEGILGIGYPTNEAWIESVPTPYSNVPASMVSQGIISSNAYSLWLDDLQANTGSILYGGIDTDKFTGTLGTLPIQPTQGTYSAFYVTLTGVAYGGNAIASNLATAVLLDSGTSLTYLPDSIVQSIYNTVKAEYSAAAGTAYVSCSLASSTSTLDFTFTSPKISVPMSELVIPLTTSTGQQSTTCLFGIAPGGNSVSVLGDTFLRSAYVVYDISNNQISLAQTDFGATTSNVVEITNGSAGVPSATVVQNPATATGAIAKGNAGATITIGISPTSTSTAGAVSTKVSLGAMGLIGAGMMYAAM